jgi:hypothetical protein
MQNGISLFELATANPAKEWASDVAAASWGRVAARRSAAS